MVLQRLLFVCLFIFVLFFNNPQVLLKRATFFLNKSKHASFIMDASIILLCTQKQNYLKITPKATRVKIISVP